MSKPTIDPEDKGAAIAFVSVLVGFVCIGAFWWEGANPFTGFLAGFFCTLFGLAMLTQEY